MSYLMAISSLRTSSEAISEASRLTGGRCGEVIRVRRSIPALVASALVGLASVQAEPTRIYIANDDHTDFMWTADADTYRNVFVDMLDADAMAMRQLNRLIADHPRGREHSQRPVDVLVMRPSEDLGTLAREFETELPRALRQVFQALGSHKTDRSNIIATLLFQPRYLRRVLEIGERDGARRRDELAVFLGLDQAGTESASPIVQLPPRVPKPFSDSRGSDESVLARRFTGTEG